MDSKIFAAGIIAVGFVFGIYLYTQDSAYKRCLEAKIEYFSHLKTLKEREETAKFECQYDQEKFIK
jgi:hypothetical protein